MEALVQTTEVILQEKKSKDWIQAHDTCAKVFRRLSTEVALSAMCLKHRKEW
jgi:hypothetical protein